MSCETGARLTIGWRVNTKDIPDVMQREHEAYWADLLPLVDRACITLSENLWHEDLCDIENELDCDMYIVGIPVCEHELATDEFICDMERRATLAREVYEQVMRKKPKDGPFIISWEKVW